MRFAVASFAVVLAGSVASAQVTVESLMGELTDLARLAEWPDPYYDTRQFSSYDPRSTDPSEATDENWFANGDRGHHVRVRETDDGPAYVLMEAQGPGAVVRIWSANPQDAGMARVYIDGAEEPALEMPLADMLVGHHAPFLPPISGVRGAGWNTYMPIPYAESIRIETTQSDYYYHVNYRTYAPGTEVVSFAGDQLTESLVIDTAKRLEERQADSPFVETRAGAMLEATASNSDGGDLALAAFEAKGPGVITEIRATVQSDRPERALRAAVLRITFDGASSPHVEVPLGDFFGTAPGISPFQSLPLEAREEGILIARWPMPHQQGYRIELEASRSLFQMLRIETQVAPYEWNERSMHFYARWRAGRAMPTQPRIDWNYANAAGAGRFVGASLHVANPLIDWWGEGDEKIYADGDRFPRFFGTGTEDYFGYAWCSSEVFTHAFHNQPRCDGPRNFGHTNVNRFHIIDDIPFAQSFRFDMELWHWKNTQVSQAVTTYFYGRPGLQVHESTLFPELLRVPRLPDPPPIEEAR